MRVKIDKRNFKFAAIVAIDKPRSVEHGNTLFNRKAATWLNETRIPFGNRNRKTRGNERTLKWGKRHGFYGAQVNTGVTWIRIRWNHRIIT